MKTGKVSKLFWNRIKRHDDFLSPSHFQLANSTMSSFSILFSCVLVSLVLVTDVHGRNLNCDQMVEDMDKCIGDLVFYYGEIPETLDNLNNDYCPQLNRRLKCMTAPRVCLKCEYSNLTYTCSSEMTFNLPSGSVPTSSIWHCDAKSQEVFHCFLQNGKRKTEPYRRC